MLGCAILRIAACLAIACGLGAGRPAPAGAEPWTLSAGAFESGNGRWSPPPMRLGLHADRWDGEEPAAAKPSRPDQQCRKWRTMARQLGETYAGYTLRHGVIKRVCPLAAERADESWDWPWAGFAQGRLPSRLHKTFAAWEIRCGSTGARRRCALIHAAALPPASPLETQRPTILAHFVIDMVAGRESVLWRVFVPTDGSVVAGVDDGARLAAAGPARSVGRAIRYRLAEADYVERYATCVAQGCMMEANIGRAGEVATRLSDGVAVDLSVTLASGREISVQLPSRGFRAAFVELMRLRREEMRGPRR